MLEYSKDKVAKRLRELRRGRGWSLSEMAKNLDSLIGQDALKKMVLGGNTGRETVSQLENAKRGITLDLAFAYSHIFDVSLDCVLARTDDWKPEYKEVKEITGLSNEAIKNLIKFKDYNGMMELNLKTGSILNYKDNTKALNELLRNDDDFQILSNIARFLFADFVSVAPVEKSTGYTEVVNGKDMNAIYLIHIQNGLDRLKRILGESKENNDVSSCQSNT